MCEGHIYDWLILPLMPEEEFAKKIRPRGLKRAAGKIAEIVFRMLHNCSRARVEAEYCMKLAAEGLKYNPNWIENRGVPVEKYPAFKLAERKFLPQVLESLDARSDMQTLRAIVEDWSCLKRGVDVDEWLGFWLLIFWEFVPVLHLEHQGLKPATGGGPAPGLRSHQPPPRVVLPPPPPPPLPRIEDIPGIPSNSPTDPLPPLRIQVTFDELYS